MIRLQVDRFDESKRILALKEAEGERYLFIGFGEREAAEIGRAMRLEPPAPDASRAHWMEMIEERGAVLESVAITDLVDGVFKADVFLTQEGRSLELASRPADALAWCVRWLISIWATDEVMRLAGVNRRFEEAELIIAGVCPNPFKEDFGAPVATYYDVAKGWQKKYGRTIVVCLGLIIFPFLALTLLLTLGFVIRVTSSGNLADIQEGISWLLPMYLCMAALIFLVWLLHHSFRHGYAELHVFPFGVRVRMGKVQAARLWSLMVKPGRTIFFVKNIDGLQSKTRAFGMGGVALSPYEKNWREGEIGGLVRRYKPILLGIEPVDPEGGSPIF
jgi:bifunctional DNase/RNase